jgi:hypothetical protein
LPLPGGAVITVTRAGPPSRANNSGRATIRLVSGPASRPTTASGPEGLTSRIIPCPVR